MDNLRRSERKNKGQAPIRFLSSDGRQSDRRCPSETQEKDNIEDDKSQKTKTSKRSSKSRTKLREEYLKNQKDLLEVQKKLSENALRLEKEMSRTTTSSQTSSGKSDSLSEISSKEKVHEWLNIGHFENEEKKNPISKTKTTDENITLLTQTIAEGMDRLSKALTNNRIHNFSQDLPFFNGKSEDWPIFKTSFERTQKHFSDEENLLRLQKSLKGEALEAVRPLLITFENTQSIMETLEIRFGRPEFIIETILQKIRYLPNLKEDDHINFVKFATEVQNFSATARNLHMEIYLSNPKLLKELLNKLPTHLKYNWAVYQSGMNIGVPTLDIFSSWIQDQARILNIFLHPKLDDRKRQEKFNPRETRNFNQRPVLTQVTPKCQICSQNHQTSKCKEILERSVDSRWELITNKKLCFSCFGHHQIKFCRKKTICGLNDCTKFHHHVLHKDNLESKIQVENPNNPPLLCSTTSYSNNEKVLLRVCPVVLSGEKNSIETYALLDDGSTVSLIDDNLAEYLGLIGEEDPLNIVWTNSSNHKDQNSRRVKLKIRGLYETEEYEINDVRTMTGFNLPSHSFDFSKMKNEWSHLSICPHNMLFENNIKPTILLGQDQYHLIMPRKIYEGPPNSPILSWTKIGWIVHGKFRYRKDVIEKCDKQTSEISDVVMAEENDTKAPIPVSNEVNIETFSTPQKNKENLPGSPVSQATPTYKKELLDNTSDISPICSQTTDIDMERDILDALDAAIEETSGNKEVERVVSSAKPAEENKIMLSSNERSNKLLNMVNVESPVSSLKKTSKRKSANPVQMKTRYEKLFSMYANKENGDEAKENGSLSCTESVEDILTFTREVPSPLAVPSSSILKRKLADTDDSCSPCPKRKRVNFSYPCITSTKLFIRHKDELNTHYKPSFGANLFDDDPQEGDSEEEDPFADPDMYRQCSPEEWTWISTDSNPADLATRFCKKQLGSIMNTLWLEGPPFLKHSKFNWPNQPSIFLSLRSDLELKKKICDPSC